MENNDVATEDACDSQEIHYVDDGVGKSQKNSEIGIGVIIVLAIFGALILGVFGAVGVLGFKISYPLLQSTYEKIIASKASATIFVIVALYLIILVLGWIGKAVIWLVRRIFTILVGLLTVAIGFGGYYFYLSRHGG